MEIDISYNTSHGFRGQLMVNLVKWVSPVYVWLFKRGYQPWQENRQSLLARHPESFGYALGTFLQENGLELMPYLESHDVYHLLSGYPPTVYGETALIFFILGNGKRSLFTLGSAFLSIILMPEWWGWYAVCFQRGRSFQYFVNEDFETWLDLPMNVISYELKTSHEC